MKNKKSYRSFHNGAYAIMGLLAIGAAIALCYLFTLPPM